MGLLIKNGEIVTASARYVADIWCEGETISRIAKDIAPPPGAEVIDASGKLVFPGFVDPHTHVYLPIKGTSAKDTYESASKAAVVGGTTCFFDMLIPARDEEPLRALERWNEKSAGQSACDHAYHMSVTRFDGEVESQLREVVAGGTTSFKVYLAYKGVSALDDAELFGTLQLAKELGVITAAHCENADAVAAMQARLIAEGKTGPRWHYHSRPPRIEAEGTHHFLSFAALNRAHAYVVHVSCAEALDVALRAKRSGVDVWVETLIAHLLLDRGATERDDFEAAKFIMTPPLRDASNHDVLWNALANGFASTVATDHAPFDFDGQKSLGRGDFTKIPQGLPGIQHRVDLLWTYGVCAGRIDVHRFVDAAATQPARIFGLFPRKGTIQLGADADLVVYDPSFRGTVSAADQVMNVDYTPFEGFAVEGRASVVTVRGEVAARDGVFVGRPGRGKLLAREPNHF